jgi:hypothetical protein
MVLVAWPRDEFARGLRAVVGQEDGDDGLMGTITRFDLVDLHERFKVWHFVETGTGAGDGIAHVLNVQARRKHESHTSPVFNVIRSCEIDFDVACVARRRFEDERRVEVFNMESDEFLPLACRMLPPDEPILFWLDAHFPGADHGGKAWDAEPSEGLRLPLKYELEAISEHRSECRDVIICDDLRIYRDGPYRHGNLPEHLRPLCPVERNVDFAYDLFDATHDIRELYDDEGYLLLTPKEKSDA